MWLLYGAAVLALSGLVGRHLGRFREAYTEMSGMMAGMMMGMLNGFLLGYCAAAASNSMFWGNLVGIVLGLTLGVYFGRAGGLMGVMDGAMGGVMGGSMGAMLAVMLAFPREAILWTAVLLGVIYVAGMAGLVVLIEQSAPGHAAFHRMLPLFARAVRREAAEGIEGVEEAEAMSYADLPIHANTTSPKGGLSQKRLVDYYAVLGVSRNATADELSEAYLEKLEGLTEGDQAAAERIERALSVLTDLHKRSVYDRRLRASEGSAGRPESEAATASRSPAVAVTAEAIRTPSDRATVRVSQEATGAASGPGREPRQERPLRGSAGVPVRPHDSKAGKRQGARGGAGGTGRQVSNPPGPRQRQAQPVRDQQQSTVISVPWAAALLGLVLLIAVGWWVVSALSATRLGAGAATNAQVQVAPELAAKAVVAPVGTDGRQTVDLVVNGANMSYEPSVIRVKQGVPVHFNLSVKGRDPG
jgi:hypothetical protein